MAESDEIITIDEVDIDEDIEIEEENVRGYEKFEDTEITGEDYIDFENLNEIEENLSQENVNAVIPITFVKDSDVQFVQEDPEPQKQTRETPAKKLFVCQKCGIKYKRKKFFDDHTRKCSGRKG